MKEFPGADRAEVATIIRVLLEEEELDTIDEDQGEAAFAALVRALDRVAELNGGRDYDTVAEACTFLAGLPGAEAAELLKDLQLAEILLGGGG